MKSAIVFTTALVCLAACHREQPKENPGVSAQRQTSPDDQDKSGVGITETTGASFVNNASAIDRIVAARCSRERICTNVGPDKHFSTGEACLREVTVKTTDDLQPSACPGGIDGKELDECLSAIEKEDCNNVVETITRLAQCTKSQLCIKRDAPPLMQR